MLELDHKESWALKNWCFWTVVLERTLKSPLHCKQIKPVNPKGNQSWILIERTDAEAPILWLPNVKSWLIGKDPDAGKDWKQEEKGTTEDKMVGWHHWLDGHEVGQAPGVGDGQGGLACYSPRGCKESDMTEQLNWANRIREKGEIIIKWWSHQMTQSLSGRQKSLEQEVLNLEEPETIGAERKTKLRCGQW